VLVEKLLELDLRSQPRVGDMDVDRLGQVVVRAELKPLHNVFSVGQAGDKDDGQVGGFRLVANALKDGEAAHARHHHVEQDDVDRGSRQQFQPGRAGGDTE
jgi:hypothetical protein